MKGLSTVVLPILFRLKGIIVTEQHPKVGTRMLTEPIQASYAASRYNNTVLAATERTATSGPGELAAHHTAFAASSPY